MYSDFERLLTERGLRVADVQKATGVSYSTFTDWKAGRYTPKYEKLKKIADFFEVPVGVLTGDKTQQQIFEREKQESEISRQILGLREQLDSYYINNDAVQIAQAMKDNEQLHALFDAAKDAAPEDLKTVYDMLLLLKQRGKNAD